VEGVAVDAPWAIAANGALWRFMVHSLDGATRGTMNSTGLCIALFAVAVLVTACGENHPVSHRSADTGVWGTPCPTDWTDDDSVAGVPCVGNRMCSIPESSDPYGPSWELSCDGSSWDSYYLHYDLALPPRPTTPDAAAPSVTQDADTPMRPDASPPLADAAVDSGEISEASTMDSG
jgi:hypothetical protein